MKKILLLGICALSVCLARCSDDNEPLPDPELTLSPDTPIAFTAEGGSVTIAVATNLDSWEAVSDQSWCAVTADKKKETFTVAAVENETLEPMPEATVTVTAVSGDRSISRELKVSQAAGEEKPVDLSADGTANCYIVPEAGSYRFTTSKVNGDEITQIASVDWIWYANTNVSQPLVSDIAYANGTVKFTATGEKGNVVLAAFDKAGKIVWSWHIWCTATPAVIEFGPGALLQDRFLGATSTQPGSFETQGLYYQWGRKDPFFGGRQFENFGAPFTEAIAETVVNTSYDTGWKAVAGSVDQETAAAHPMSYYCDENKSSDWLNQQDNTLWGTVKTNYDPCPAGFRTPAFSELAFLKSLNEDDYDYTNIGLRYNIDGITSWFPAQGNREPSGELMIFDDGGGVYIWSNEVRDFQGLKYPWRTIIDEFDNMDGPGARSMGQPVRCVAQ